MLSDALRRALEGTIGAHGPVRSVTPIGGGSIAAAFRIDTAGGRFFLKTGPASHPFDAEADGLGAIAATNTLRVPRPLQHGVAGAEGFLLLEWIDLGDRGDWHAAGAQLAALHAIAGKHFGWRRDNTIGATAQCNTPCATWAEFYRERRLRPQLYLAAANGHARLAALTGYALRASDALLAHHAPPAALLHGDLWRGNLAFDTHGAPVVLDPACYCGDPETDLAMARLFGGFPAAFFDAYDRAHAPAPGARARSTLYQLYHVLNHANLFGGGYVGQAQAMIERMANASGGR